MANKTSNTNSKRIHWKVRFSKELFAYQTRITVGTMDASRIMDFMAGLTDYSRGCPIDPRDAMNDNYRAGYNHTNNLVHKIKKGIFS